MNAIFDTDFILHCADYTMVKGCCWSQEKPVLCCQDRSWESGTGPIGGYYNSCSFAHWSGKSSPQGQGAVSGILIGKPRLIFTSPQILLHLLANEERFYKASLLEDSQRKKTQCNKTLFLSLSYSIQRLW